MKLTSLNLSSIDGVGDAIYKYDREKFDYFFEGQSDKLDDEFKKELMEYVLDLFVDRYEPLMEGMLHDGMTTSTDYYNQEEVDKIINGIMEGSDISRRNCRNAILDKMFESNKDQFFDINKGFVDIFMQNLVEEIEKLGLNVVFEYGKLASQLPSLYIDKKQGVIDMSIMNDDLRIITASFDNTTNSQNGNKYTMNEFLSDDFNKERYTKYVLDWLQGSYGMGNSITDILALL